MRTACFLVTKLGRAVGHPGAGGGKGKNTLDLKITDFQRTLPYCENVTKDKSTPAPCRTPV